MRTRDLTALLIGALALILSGCAPTPNRALYEAVGGYNTLARLYLDIIQVDKADGSLADPQLLSAADVARVEKARQDASRLLDIWRQQLAQTGGDAVGAELDYWPAFERFYAAWLAARTKGADTDG